MLKLGECPIPVHGIVILLILSVADTDDAAQQSVYTSDDGLEALDGINPVCLGAPGVGRTEFA